jgi:hypothetical protein
VAQLRPHHAELAGLRTQVLILTFGTEAWARAWLRETDAPFPLLLDQDRRVYRAYGLERSVVRTWSPRTIWYYLRRASAGHRLRPVQGDPHQMGGDFIVDARGILRLAHRSRDPVDRPSSDRLLSVVRGLPPHPVR